MKTRYHDEHSCEICQEKGGCECINCMLSIKVTGSLTLHDPNCIICGSLKYHGKTSGSLSLPYTNFN